MFVFCFERWFYFVLYNLFIIFYVGKSCKIVYIKILVKLNKLENWDFYMIIDFILWNLVLLCLCWFIGDKLLWNDYRGSGDVF